MRFELRTDAVTGQRSLATALRGRALLLDPFLNKGTAFSAEERASLGLTGLVPPVENTFEEQLERAYRSFEAKPTPLEKYIFLASLQDRNEVLFYRLLQQRIDEMMPIVYTPTVGEACQRFSDIYRRPRGLYVSYAERDSIESVLANAGAREPSVIVVTDGERILGLGDQGVGGMGIPIGKLALYTLCAGIAPYETLAITLDVGTENVERLADPLYLGLRRRRVRGDDYQAFVDAFVAALRKLYPNVLLQWEDFLKENALFQLERFRDQLCTFNDDIQGTAAVALAGIYSGLRATKRALRDQKIVLAGAGAAAQGIAHLLAAALEEDGLSGVEARRCIWMVDSRGLVTTARPDLEGFKAHYARSADELAGYRVDDRERIGLEETIAHAKPTVLLGISGQPGLFTESVVKTMAEDQERPLVLPLSNPTSKSECTAEEAIRWSGGRALVATGSPFAPVTYGGTRHRIGQGNNAYVFPGVGLGVVVARARRVTDGMFLDAARALAAAVSESDLAESALYPQLSRIREVSHAVACAVVRRAVAEGHADPLEPLEERVRSAMWEPEYLPIVAS